MDFATHRPEATRGWNAQAGGEPGVGATAGERAFDAETQCQDFLLVDAQQSFAVTGFHRLKGGRFREDGVGADQFLFGDDGQDCGKQP